MGQAESQPQLDQAVKTGVAFHVLRVAERSPAASAGIDPFFDFICGVNGQPLVRCAVWSMRGDEGADALDENRERTSTRSPTCSRGVKGGRSTYKSTAPSARSYEVSLSASCSLFASEWGARADSLVACCSTDVPLIPSRTWSTGTSPSDAQPSLIGLSLRLCNPQHALEQVRDPSLGPDATCSSSESLSL